MTVQQLSDIMDALMIFHWGILNIDDSARDWIRDREAEVLRTHAMPEFTEQADKRRLPEWVKGILSVAIPYDYLGMAPYNRPGLVDSYAWAADYHRVLKGLLSEMDSAVRNASEDADFSEKAEVLPCVDTSPYMDREIGLYTGLGKFGKNHFLIHKTLGTHFFIGYLLYNRPLPVSDLKVGLPEALDVMYPECNTCDRCVVACPAEICGFGPMAHERCVSALTQTARILTEGEMKRIGNHLYGCSICQRVCPANRENRAHPSFEIHEENVLSPEEMLSLSGKQFKARYGDKGFSWRSLWIYKRNALIVLGNTGKQKERELILSHPEFEHDERLKPYYKWALQEIERRLI